MSLISARPNAQGGGSSSSSDPASQQSGQVDWVALGNSTFSASVAVLARFSRGGVEALTLAIAQAISAKFVLSFEGSQRVGRAVDSAKGVAGLQKALWFGFGINHVVRDLAATNHGLSCLALVGAMTEVHPEEFSAHILNALTKTYLTPETLQPSPQQWLALVSLLNGALRCSSFAIVAESFMKGCPLRSSLGGPSEIADALLGISKLSTGELNCITLVGGRTCGWLAAVGHWFFGLSIRIVLSDGTLIIETVPHGFDAQISVRYTEFEEGISRFKFRTSPTRNQQYSQSSAAVIFSATYLVTGKRDFLNSPVGAFPSGRVEHSRCISEIFLGASRAIVEPKNLSNMGCLIGNMAAWFELDYRRWLTSIDTSHFDSDPVGHKIRSAKPKHYGTEYILNAIHWFPELAQAEPTMHRSYRDSTKKIEQHSSKGEAYLLLNLESDICSIMAEIDKHCLCFKHKATACSETWDFVGFGYCASRFAILISHIIWALGSVEIDEKYPLSYCAGGFAALCKELGREKT